MPCRTTSGATANASLPLQIDDVLETILGAGDLPSGDIFFFLVSFHTAVDIAAASIRALYNLTRPDNTTAAFSAGNGIGAVLLRPTRLPIAAGASNVLLPATERNPFAVGHWVERELFYDEASNLIGCAQTEFDVVAVKEARAAMG